MPERLVDVKEDEERLLHVFPVSLTDENASEAAYKQKALEAAGHCGLVPDSELGQLDSQMHISRGGPLEPQSDDLGVLTETKERLDDVVQIRAYYLWEDAGRPEGQSDTFWHQARHQHFSKRAYALWEREGRPADQADKHWYRIRSFEEN